METSGQKRSRKDDHHSTKKKTKLAAKEAAKPLPIGKTPVARKDNNDGTSGNAVDTGKAKTELKAQDNEEKKKNKAKKKTDQPVVAENNVSPVTSKDMLLALLDDVNSSDELPSDEDDFSDDVTDKNKKNAQLNRDDTRRKLLIVNRKLKEAAQNKQLGIALEEFSRLKKIGIHPSVHTYTSLINACVRAGETERGLTFFKEMETEGVAANEITYTTVIKGLAADGDMSQIRIMLKTMRRKGLQANVRTYDTVLRGCVRSGDSKMAIAIWGAMQADGCSYSTASYEYFIKTLCENLKVDLAWKIVALMQEKADIRQSPVFAYIAKACALVGDYEATRKALSISEHVMAMNAPVPSAPKSKQKNTKLRKKLLQEGALSLLAHDHQARSGKQSASHSLFLRLRTQETQRECSEVEEYLSSVKAAKMPPPSSSIRFGPDMDLPLVRHLPGKVPAMLDIKRAFANNLPVRMEVCSGSGEWAVSRAHAEQGQYNWVANEIRFDRCYDIWARTVFKQVNNLLLLCGDGRAISDKCLPTASVNEVFINFPEPPVWAESKWRLLDSALFNILHRVLVPGGRLHILTDDESLCRDTAAELSKVKNLFLSAHSTAWVTRVPDDYGTESYFDRMWKHGERRRRFYLLFDRI